jgi:hypothetical protein
VTITGSVSTYSTAFSFPVKSAGTASTTNNNSQLTSYFNGSDLVIPDNQSASFAGGTYYLHKIDVGKNSTLRFTGPTIIYLYADTTIDGDLGCTTGKPEHLQIYMTVAHWIHIREKAHVYAVIYNPTDDIQIEDDAQLFGSGIATNFIIKDRARAHYDTALGTGDGSTASSVCIVK